MRRLGRSSSATSYIDGQGAITSPRPQIRPQRYTGTGLADVIPGFIAPTSALYGPSVNVAGIISADFIAPGSTLYGPGLVLDTTLSADFIAPSSELYAPSVDRFGTISVDYIPPSSSLSEPVLYQSEVANTWFNEHWWRSPYFGTGWWGARLVATADTIASTASLSEPTLTPGEISISADFISTAHALYEPGVSVDGVIAAPFISSTENVFAPSVIAQSVQPLAVGFISSVSSVYDPSVVNDSSSLIDGQSSLVISTNYQSKTLYNNNGYFTID